MHILLFNPIFFLSTFEAPLDEAPVEALQIGRDVPPPSPDPEAAAPRRPVARRPSTRSHTSSSPCRYVVCGTAPDSVAFFMALTASALAATR